MLRPTPRHINPGIHSGILLSVISSGVASGVLSGIKYGVLSGKSFANFTWQKFWRSVWHTFWSDWWKVRLLKICRVWVSCRDHRFFCLFAGFHPSNGRAIWHIAYIFMFGTGLEPGQVAGTLDMRSCAPSISTWHFGTLLRPPGNLKWGPNAYPTKKPSPTKLHSFSNMLETHSVLLARFLESDSCISMAKQANVSYRIPNNESSQWSCIHPSSCFVPGIFPANPFKHCLKQMIIY